MARRSNAEREFQNLSRRIELAFVDSPLANVGQRLLDILDGISAAVREDVADSDQLKATVNYVRRCFEPLPHSFGGRFAIDAALIQALSEEWSEGPVKLSSMVVPSYSTVWGHLSVEIPVEKHNFHVIDIILFRGEDDVHQSIFLTIPGFVMSLATTFIFAPIFLPSSSNHDSIKC